MMTITPTSFELLRGWYSDAIEMPEIARFLSMSKYIEMPKIEDFSGDWGVAGFLSGSGKTFLRVGIERGGSDNLAVSLWSLAQGMRRKIEAGRAIIFARDVLVRRYGALSVSACVHGTNGPSLALISSILGAPWGIEPAGAWDRETGRWVEAHHFRSGASQALAPARGSVVDPARRARAAKWRE